MGGVELVVTLHGRGRACPARRFAWADVCGWLPGGWPLAQGFRGVGDAAPYGFPGKGRRRDPPPSSGPAGPPSPKGEGKGCCWRRKVAAGWGHPALRIGIWKRPRGLRGHPFPDRRTVGAGHARPGGLRGHPSMVRSVGRGLDPSAGVGGSGSLRGASGTPPPTACPGMGGSGSLPLIRPCGATFPQGGRQGLLLAAAGGRGGVGAPRPTDRDMETPAGFTRTPVPGPPHGRGRACPARGVTRTPVNGSVRREGS